MEAVEQGHDDGQQQLEDEGIQPVDGAAEQRRQQVDNLFSFFPVGFLPGFDFADAQSVSYRLIHLPNPADER